MNFIRGWFKLWFKRHLVSFSALCYREISAIWPGPARERLAVAIWFEAVEVSVTVNVTSVYGRIHGNRKILPCWEKQVSFHFQWIQCIGQRAIQHSPSCECWEITGECEKQRYVMERSQFWGFHSPKLISNR